jgi:hypothetical protein
MMAKGKDPLMQQAKREVRSTTVRPQLQALRRAGRQGKQDFNEAQQRVAQVTGALLGQLGQIPGAYAGQTGGIIGNVTSGIGALGEQLGQNSIGQVPVAEQAAGIANVGAIGSGAIEQIAGQQQNMADYLASGAQQGAVQGAVTSRNYLKDYSNFQKDIRQQKVDVIKSSRDQILNRLDQLKQERFDRSMALKQLGMQQQQIDQANRALDAQIALEEARAKWLRNHSGGHGPGNDNGRSGETTQDTSVPAPGSGGYGYNVLDPSVTNPSFAGSQTPLSPTAEPYTFVQWLDKQPLKDPAGRQAATAQVMQWLQYHGEQPVLAADGTIQLSSLANPVNQDVIQHFNAVIGVF